MFDTIETYKSDLALFEKLGLKPFSGLKTHTKHYIGKVTDGDSYAEIWVTGMPAMFWDFKIYDSERKVTYGASTGSGSLSAFWPTVKNMMQNMFVVDTVVIEGE